MKELLFLWVVFLVGILMMPTHHTFETLTNCQTEIRRLELEYYRDRLQHKPDYRGDTYHLECLTTLEAIRRISEFNLKKLY